MSERSSAQILEEGRNCWRSANGSRVAFLIDNDAYFRALHDCLLEARRSVFIIGWELDPRVSLVVEEGKQRRAVELAPFLSDLLDRRSSLEVWVLRWNYAPMRVPQNLFPPASQSAWPDHDRFRLHVDGAHAPGASHHQKIVVVDDEVAFCGGMDLTWRRWDTPEHRAEDTRRVDRNGHAYDPWHDVQLAVAGDAAAVLGELARERWRRATGEDAPPAPKGSSRPSPWPDKLGDDLRNVPVAVSRTVAAFEDHPEVNEIETLYLDAIAAARKHIYIENQYLTSRSIGEALEARLQERDGPEIVIVTPSECAGWLEDGLMSALRVRLLNRLERANRFNRLRTYCPVVPNLDGGHVDVHSKVLVIDDCFVTVGSANVSNRSMALDTEANLAIEATPRARKRRRAIARFRNRLVAEHLGVDVERVETALKETGSLVRTIDELATGPRTLEPLANEYPEWIRKVAPTSSLSDPERPVDSQKIIEALIPKRAADLSNHPMAKLVLATLAVSAFALWRFWPGGPGRRESSGTW